MLLTRAYYLLKPAIPRGLRMALRGLVARRRRPRYVTSWPINQVAGRVPDGFPGWPDGKEFAFVLTHDVETKKGLDRCRELADMDMRLGFRSSFNFVPEGDYETPDSLRAWLTTNGFEVGVHDLRHDGQLYNSRKSFAAQAQRINHYLEEWKAVGFRSAFMFRDLRWLQDLNILYDTSTFDTDPFEPQSAGVNTIFPFWVPRDDHSGYVELPYTLPQDSTLFLLLQEPAIDAWKRKLDWIAQQGGMALLNTHPDYMNFNGRGNRSEYSARMYQEFLGYVAERYGHRCWFALPRDVAEHTIGAVRHGVDQPIAFHAASSSRLHPSSRPQPAASSGWCLRGKRAAMVSFSPFPNDPRPHRAADALVKEGMSVDMICAPGDEKEPKREVLNGVEILRVPISRRRGGLFEYVFQYSAFILMSSAILALRSLIRRYDLVYVHNMPDILVLSALIPKALGAKVILDLHDPMPELMMTIFKAQQDSLRVRVLRRLEKWSIGRADLVLTVNLACKRIFGSRSCPPEKIGVVMNSPGEIFRFQAPRLCASASNASDKPFVIMYHGTIVERNGLDLAVDALENVRQVVPAAELRVYGSKTRFLEHVMESARNRGLQDAVHYFGPKRLEEIVQAIGECDVGIIPNQRNIFTEINTPTRIFEYLALGKPVIAPRAPGIQEYFKEESLLFFELGNVEELARKIEYVYSHPSETVEIVKQGQQAYRAHTWRQERQNLVNLVGELLETGD
ncbi:MAG: glycosyltransferase [Acidobacteria bacterium]|nr:glycosyltransferase [Acidobacteriota bacterium]